MVKISIIIPIYNCEQFLKKCVESVLRQTLKELEIVCIDDGSTDQSVTIIKELMRTDDRIILYQKKNTGPGAARNIGITKAKGKYIAFLDADDFYWDISGLEQLWTACETKNTVAGISLRWCINGFIERLEYFEEDFCSHKVLCYNDCQMDYHFYCCIFLREMLVEREIFFPLYYRYEDPPFLVKALYEADRFAVVDTCLYYYRKPIARKRFNKEKTLDLLCGLMDNLMFAQEHHLNILFDNTVQRLEYEYMGIILENISSDDLCIIKKLLQINEIVVKAKGNKDYIIRPLRGVLLCVNQYGDEIISRIKSCSKIALYGAGRYGQAFLRFLKEKDCFYKVSQIIVTEQNGNKFELEGIKVVKLKDYEKADDQYIFVTAGEKFQQEIEKNLKKNSYRNYEIIRDEFLQLITENMGC